METDAVTLLKVRPRVGVISQREALGVRKTWRFISNRTGLHIWFAQKCKPSLDCYTGWSAFVLSFSSPASFHEETHSFTRAVLFDIVPDKQLQDGLLSRIPFTFSLCFEYGI
jgi:hypothetical protein